MQTLAPLEARLRAIASPMPVSSELMPRQMCCFFFFFFLAAGKRCGADAQSWLLTSGGACDECILALVDSVGCHLCMYFCVQCS